MLTRDSEIAEPWPTSAVVEVPTIDIAPQPAVRPAIFIERVDGRAMAGFQTAWSDLVERVLEPNVFLDPAFAIPLLQHFRFDPRPDFLLAWEEDGSASFGKLVGLMPVHIPRSRLWRLASGYHHRQVTLGTPLLDATRGAEVLGSMLGWIGDTYPRLAGLILTEIPAAGAFHDVLSAWGLKSDHTIDVLDQRQRAVFHHGAAAQQADATSLLSSKRLKELRRQRRRLGETGNLTYHSAKTLADVRRAAERFLALEAEGWKGARGSALLADPTQTTFVRAMTRMMAHEGRCRIDSLELDGVPVAMGVIVMAGSRAHFWKTAFDERFAAFSPGVQFAIDLTNVQRADPSLTLTDSCAIPDHPMIDRIWSDRMAVVDVLIELRPTGASPKSRAGSLRRAVRLESWRRALRGVAKTAVNGVLRWRG